ncbi:unnamed protein product [Blepharisma stoltei]|uniref:Amino acid transporter transmembrane domain-containing protein n=1 Tax=Blepharisma stoltei TaxID=1481888 RepID=A0AAU9IBC8_9CILI|nr:unnamed protein product [Blepharisma stoltei]
MDMESNKLWPTFCIFCAFTIGGGTLSLPDSSSKVGIIPSLVTFFLIAGTFYIIYFSFIYACEETSNLNYGGCINSYYNSKVAKLALITMLFHCMILICNHQVRIISLIRFDLTWVGILDAKNYESDDFFLLDKYIILIIISIPLILFGKLEMMFSLKYFPVFSIVVWVYLILLTVYVIADGKTEPKIVWFSSQWNDLGQLEIVWNSVDAFAAIQCLPRVHKECNDPYIIREAVRLVLFTVLILFSVTALLGSIFYVGSIDNLQLIYFGISKENLSEQFSITMAIGIFGIAISLIFSTLLLLHIAKLCWVQIIHGISFDNEKVNHDKISFWLVGFVILIFIVCSNILNQIKYSMQISNLVICLIFPLLIYLKMGDPGVHKIIFGVWISFLSIIEIIGLFY